MSLAKTKCLVTGGGGLLGSWLVKKLLETGRYEVKFTDIREMDIGGATFIKSDITKFDQVCTVFYH